MWSRPIAAALIAMSMAGTAQANFYFHPRYYVGAALALTHVRYANADKPDLNLFKQDTTSTRLAIQGHRLGGNVFAGVRWTSRWGVEIGFGSINKAKASVQNNNEAVNRISLGYVDGLWYHRLAQELDVIASVGAGILHSKCNVIGDNVSFTEKSKLERRRINYRVGIGSQYRYRKTALRLMLRYQRGTPNFVKSAASVSLGGIFYF